MQIQANRILKDGKWQSIPSDYFGELPAQFNGYLGAQNSIRMYGKTYFTIGRCYLVKPSVDPDTHNVSYSFEQTGWTKYPSAQFVHGNDDIGYYCITYNRLWYDREADDWVPINAVSPVSIPTSMGFTSEDGKIRFIGRYDVVFHPEGMDSHFSQFMIVNDVGVMGNRVFKGPEGWDCYFDNGKTWRLVYVGNGMDETDVILEEVDIGLGETVGRKVRTISNTWQWFDLDGVPHIDYDRDGVSIHLVLRDGRYVESGDDQVYEGQYVWMA